MKKILLILMMCIFHVIGVFAQESVKPTFDDEIQRTVSFLVINGHDSYENATIKIKATSPDYFLTDHYKVKVTVTDAEGKTIYKKTFRDNYLYIFSNAQIEVGKPRFSKLIIYKSYDGKDWLCDINEKEGIF